jgi:hypothetical protein
VIDGEPPVGDAAAVGAREPHASLAGSLRHPTLSLPLDGGGMGWGWSGTLDVLDTPLPDPPPQGGRVM